MKEELREKGTTLLEESRITIDRLVHIASMGIGFDVMNILEGMEFEDISKIIPSLDKDMFKEYQHDEEIYELMCFYDKLGFLAKCYFNIPTNFTFRNDGSFKSCWSSREFREFYVYGETMEELLDNALKLEEEMFNEEIKKNARK